MNLYAKFISAFGGRIINMFYMYKTGKGRKGGNTELKGNRETGKKMIWKKGKNKLM